MQIFTLPDETRRSLKDIKPACSSFVPGHGLERGIVMQKTGERDKRGLWEKERVRVFRGGERRCVGVSEDPPRSLRCGFFKVATLVICSNLAETASEGSPPQFNQSHQCSEIHVCHQQFQSVKTNVDVEE